MNRNEFKIEIQNYINKLIDKEEFDKLFIEIDVEDSFQKGLEIKDNSALWIPKSYSAASEISQYARDIYAKGEQADGFLLTIRFSKKISKSSMPLTSEQKTMFLTETPKFRLEDVILSDDTREKIMEAIATIESFDMVYNQWNFKSKEPSAKTNICFFGVPGTGKTMCAHAVANSLNKKILIASYADIQSEYVGVGPKNLKQLFQQAESENALLFFDEADSFLRKRTSDTSSSASMHYNSMTNEMMKHLEDFNGVVIFATNLTENTDEAFKTRLSFSIEFKAPDETCRAQIIEKMIPVEVPFVEKLSSEDYIDLSKCCEGFVGRDIRNAVKTTLSVGAQKQEYPFTKEYFIAGLKNYKENKSSFDKSMTKTKKNTNPMDIYTTNGCIHTLLTYAAWVDGPENELEAEYLRLYSNQLNRNKLVINKLTDLPELEEICLEVKDDGLKIKTVLLLVDFMAQTKQSKDNLWIIEKMMEQFKFSDELKQMFSEYYQSQASSAEVKNKIKKFNINN